MYFAHRSSENEWLFHKRDCDDCWSDYGYCLFKVGVPAQKIEKGSVISTIKLKASAFVSSDMRAFALCSLMEFGRAKEHRRQVTGVRKANTKLVAGGAAGGGAAVLRRRCGSVFRAGGRVCRAVDRDAADRDLRQPGK